MRATHLVITVVVSLFLVTTIGFAQTPPSGDSYVASSTPTTNYGPSTILPLQPGVRSYVRFDLSGIPANATVQKAVIRLFVDGVMTPGSFDVYRINTAWDENTLTWSNKPVLGASATGNNPVAIAATNSKNFILVDITPLVKNWVNGTVPNNGIALTLTTTAGSFSFDSKENAAASHEPALEIAIPGATGLQGPQGPQGLTGATGATGPQGPQGPQGQTGTTGPQGPIGPIGPQGPAGQDGTNGTNGTNGTGFTFRDGFDNSASYAINDVVTYNGSSYVAIAASQGPNNPTPDMNPAAWTLMAQEGAQGPTGAAGPPGAPGPTGPQGPIGPTGAQGAAGPMGPQGQTGLTGATGAQGPQGLIGPSGPAGPSGTTGQSATTVFSTSSLPVTPATHITQVPGLSFTLVVPSNAVVLVATDGGLQTVSQAGAGYSAIGISLLVDGLFLPNGGSKLVEAVNNAGLVGAVANWSLSQALNLSPGTHTIAVSAQGLGAGSDAIVGGGATDFLQAELTVTVLNQ